MAQRKNTLLDGTAVINTDNHQKSRVIPRKPAVLSNPAREVINRERRSEIQLQMLTWFLRANLPEMLPEHFKSPPQIIPHTEQGVSNFTFFTLTDAGEDVVIRMKQRPESCEREGEQWSDFHKEAWIASLVNDAVPIPRVLSEGIGYVEALERQHAYAIIVQERIPFQSATAITSPTDRLTMMEQVGHIAREINSVKVPGFGMLLHPDRDEFALPDWHSYLQAELKECQLDRLFDEGRISSVTLQNIEAVVRWMSDQHIEPTLIHSDFTNNWGNILIDDNQRIQAVIDWEFAAGGAGSAREIAVTEYVHIRNGVPEEEYREEFTAFLQGYGLTGAEYRDSLKAMVDAHILLHATQKVVRYQNMRESGELTAPWQIEFADRAEELIASLSKRLCR